MIHSELIFMMSIKSMSRLIFFLTFEYPVAPAPSVEKTIFTALYYLLSLVKYQLIIFIGMGGRIQSLSLDSNLLLYLYTLCCCSVTKFCPILRNPMDGSIPGFPVPHHLLEFAQVHVCWIGDAIQPFHPLSPSSPSPINLSQHQGLLPVSQLFTSGGQSIGASASVLPKSSRGWFLLRLTDLISLLFKGLSRVFSNTTVWKLQFFSTLPSLVPSSHIHTWLLERP